MSSLAVTRSNLQLVGSKERFLQLVKKNEEFCPVCDGWGYTVFHTVSSEEPIEETCHFCTDFAMTHDEQIYLMEAV